MNPRSNPYVGPRAFQPGEPFYGRDRELRSLSSLLIAERIVLMHSPSGAGKTSLMQAGLLPRLADESFDVLPVIRLNQEPPADMADAPGFNRYALSMMLSLEEGVPAAQRLGLRELVSLTLDEYLVQRPKPPEASPSTVLVFDQFEEILTVSPTDRESKLAFFEQLGKALRDKSRWALVAIREDYLGALAPFTRPIPGRFAATFRLDLIGVEGAMQAIQRPSLTQGVEFSTSAAQKLVDDLRRVQVQLPNGKLEDQLGLHVEPVQLQVVCYRLWQGLSATDQRIDESHLAGVGDVNQSLADYYAASVQNVATKSATSPRAIREWFDRKLITPEGIRGQVLMGAETSDGLPNPVVSMLEDAHIIRGEKRAGKTWYELSHDRLIQPVRTNNAAWFAANLSLFQQQAILWSQQGRPEGMLLRGKPFEDAERQAAAISLTVDEKSFLEACRKLNQAERREKLRTRIIQGLAFAALLAMVAAIAFGIRAGNSERQAQEARIAANAGATQASQNAATAVSAQATALSNEKLAQENSVLAKARELSAQSILRKEDFFQPELSFLLAAEAYQHMDRPETRNALLTTLQAPQYSPLSGFLTLPSGISLPDGSIMQRSINQALALGPDGKTLFVGRQDGTILLWDLQTRAPLQSLVAHPPSQPSTTLLFNNYETTKVFPIIPNQGVRGLAFHPNGKTFVSSGSDGKLILWDAASLEQFKNISTPKVTYTGLVTDNETRLASPAVPGALLFSPDGKSLYVALDACPRNPAPKDGICPILDGVVILDADTLDLQTTLQTDGPVYGLSVSPDGRTLAVTSQMDIRLWDTQTWKQSAKLSGHTDEVLTVAFNPNGKTLVSGSYDGTMRLWNLNTNTQIGEPLLSSKFDSQFPNRKYPVTHLSFSPDGRFFSSLSVTHVTVDSGLAALTLWDAKTYEKVKFYNYDVPWRGHFYEVYQVIFTPDGNNAYSGGVDEAIRIWDVTYLPQYGTGQMRLGHILPGHQGPVTMVGFSPDSEILASVSDDGTMRLWDVNKSTQIGGVWTSRDVPISTFAFSPDGVTLVTGAWDGAIRFWDIHSGKELGDPITKTADIVLGLVFSPDGKTLYSIGYKQDGSEKVVRIWDVESRKQVGKLAGSSQVIVVIAISPDGKTLATSAYGEKAIRFWDLETRKQVGEPIKSSATIVSLAFSPDSKKLVSAHYQDRILLMWDVETHQQVGAAFTNTLSNINAVAYSPDGTMLASGAWDFFVRLWNTETHNQLGEVLDTSSGHQEGVLAVAFSPDGKWLASGSQDTTIRLWSVDPGDWLQSVCQLASRNFTPEEWQEWFSNEPYHATCPQWPASQP